MYGISKFQYGEDKEELPIGGLNDTIRFRFGENKNEYIDVTLEDGQIEVRCIGIRHGPLSITPSDSNSIFVSTRK